MAHLIVPHEPEELVISLGVVERAHTARPLGSFVRVNNHSYTGWEYRKPEDGAKIARGDDLTADVREWHQDCNGSGVGDAENCPWVILWSDVYPTELLLPDGTVSAGQPGEFVLFDNRRVRHRTPPDYVRDVRLHPTTTTRHFMRAICSSRLEPVTYDDVERWRRQVDELRDYLTPNDGLSLD